MEENKDKKLVCRKCSGSHLTIKCNKEQTTTKLDQDTFSTHNNVLNSKNKFNLTNPNTSKINKNYRERNHIRSINRVKITDLPSDMTEEEMMELTYKWGHIVRIRVLNYNESSTAYVDFEYKEEAEYFVKALNKTPFEYLLISVHLVELI
jgi:RNA recognition motif-containing protein